MLWTDFDAITPWRDLYRLKNEMNKIFSDYQTRTSAEYPLINIWSSADDALLTAEVPGIDAHNIELSISGDTITLKGETTTEKLKEEECYHRQERPYGKFTRSIKLPFIVDSNKVEAECKNGILKIKLPKTEDTKQKKITIKS
ncbi:MAG: Hsp20/alpha crystallin family protein [bacterium]